MKKTIIFLTILIAFYFIPR